MTRGSRFRFNSVIWLGLVMCLPALSHTQPAPSRAARPNILVAVADDWSWPHAGAYGDTVVKTPTLDRIAREGVLFANAFSAAPSCTASRAAILTGQYPHRLEEGGNLWGFLPKTFVVFPDLLEQAGYQVGFTRKGWGPGQFEPGGRTRNPAGPTFANFATFFKNKPAGTPFSFWFGSRDPHRPYEKGSGQASGMRLDQIKVPPYLPDTPEIRGDLADYYVAVQRFDRDVGEILRQLAAAGELDNTLVIMTSDNGLPFPRAKANVYDGGVHVPLAMRWPGRVKSGLSVDAFTNLSDLAPTVLEAAGLKPPAAMTGRSLLTVAAGQRDAARDRVFVERERHANVRAGDLSYPMRAVRTRDYLYIRNLRPDRWPAGDPQLHVAVGPYGDIDDGPSKALLLSRPGDPLFTLATAKRPAEELYDLRSDPWEMVNVAGRASLASAKTTLAAMLRDWMRTTGDPRAIRDDDRWDTYPYYGPPAAAAPGRGTAAIGNTRLDRH